MSIAEKGRSGHGTRQAQARSWLFALGALSGLAFAPPVQAIATFAGNTNITMGAVTASADVVVTATASVFDLVTAESGTGTADASSSVGTAPGDSVTVDLLAQTLTVSAAVSGSVAPPEGMASAQSFNDVFIDIINNSEEDVAAVTLTFSYDQLVSAVTSELGELARAGGDILFTDDLDAVVVDSVLAAVAANGASDGDSAGATVQVDYVLDPGQGVTVIGLLGFVDAMGAAAVPEPATGLLLLAGLAGLGYGRRRRG